MLFDQTGYPLANRSSSGLIREVLELNETRSREFCSPETISARAFYLSEHSANIIVFKCMDGRINLPLICNIPVGIMQPYRNIGGKFSLGDAGLRSIIRKSIENARPRRTIILCTYHFSKGDHHRGCAGHQHDTKAAMRGAIRLKREFETAYGEDNQFVTAFLIGIETDNDALVFCRGGEEQFSMEDYAYATDEEVRRTLFATYSGRSGEILKDLLPLALGNRDHVAKILENGRPPADLVHGENIIAVGRGFPWLHLPNRALIIGPFGSFDSSWRDAVEVAGDIVRKNFASNKNLGKDGALLLVSAPYWDIEDRGLAVVGAQYHAEVAENALRPFAQEIRLETLVGVTNTQTMRFEVIPTSNYD
jgi:hypothetical protein